jgi:outer membrane lipoprotein-sorting protein
MIGHSFPTLEEMPYIPTMNTNRIIPTAGIFLLIPLYLWAQAPAPAPSNDVPAATKAPGAAMAPAAATPPAPPTEAELTLDEAAKKVAAITTVSADLLQTVKMLKQQFVIKGSYLKAPGSRISLKMVVSGLPGAAGEMLQVSDGVTIWDFQQVLESKYCRKVTLAPILEKLKAPELDVAARDQIFAQLGIAGPEALLLGLRQAIHFDQKEDGTLKDGRPAWILRGTWQDRQGLLGPNQQPLPATAALPAYIPSQATVSIGKADGWPYEVRLAGQMPSVIVETRRIGPDGRPIGSLSSRQTIDPSVVELTYSNVTLDPKLTGNEFVYNPPASVRPDDITETLLSGLEQMIQNKINQQKAETARADPLLNQSISVPKPPVQLEGAAPPTSPPLAEPR